MGREEHKRVHEECLSSDCFYIFSKLAQFREKREGRKEMLTVGKEEKEKNR